MNALANRIASGLVKLGIGPGDAVAICAPNSTEWISVYFGAIKTGTVAVTLPGLLLGPELKQLIDEARPRMIYTAPEKLHELNLLRRPGILETIICQGGDISFYLKHSARYLGSYGIHSGYLRAAMEITAESFGGMSVRVPRFFETP